MPKVLVYLFITIFLFGFNLNSVVIAQSYPTGCFFGGSTTSPNALYTPSYLQQIVSNTSNFIGIKHPANCNGNSLNTVYENKDSKGNIIVVYTNQVVPSSEDRYQIDFSTKINHLYGLGSQVKSDQIEIRPDNVYTENGKLIEDLLDTQFSEGHMNYDYFVNNSNPKVESLGYDFEGDTGFMRLPIIIIPELNLLVAYYQPAVKMVRITKEPSVTTIVLKKNPSYDSTNYETISGENPGDISGSFILVKGNSVSDLYSTYYSFIKNKGSLIKKFGNTDFFYKKPNPKAYGLGYETYNEFVESYDYTLNDVIDRYGRLKNAGLSISNFTIGSGYWSYDYGDKSKNDPAFTMEGFKKRDSFLSLPSFINSTFLDGVYVLLGMRHNVHEKRVNDFISRFNSLAGTSYNIFSFFYSSTPNDAKSFSKNSRILRLNNVSMMSSFVDNIKKTYGNINGIKEDEMFHVAQTGLRLSLSDSTCPQKTFCSNYTNSSNLRYYLNLNDPAYQNTVNIPEGFMSGSYEIWSDKYNGNAIVWGKHDYFSVGTDLQQSLSPRRTLPYYELKDEFETAMVHVLSGYPHPVIHQDSGVPASSSSCIDLSVSGVKDEYLANVKLNAFLPGSIYSCGFWNLKDSVYETSSVYYMSLAQRLQQYKYDQAMRWYETGVPSAIKPLLIDWQGDNNVYQMYQKHDSVNSINSSAVDEFVVGDSILVTPIFTNSSTIKVYLPSGSWKCLLKKCAVSSTTIISSTGVTASIAGGKTYTYNLDFSANKNDYPVFLKDGNIFVIGNFPDTNYISAYVTLDTLSTSKDYTFYPISYDLNNYDTQSIKKYILRANKSSGKVYLSIYSGTTLVAKFNMQNDAWGKGYYISNFAFFGQTNSFVGDVNNDGKVDFNTDVPSLIHTIFTHTGTVISDLNFDTKVNVLDLLTLINSVST
ncbi:hypothetical protein COV24_00095 [candidate division WWE3 bacterium CG10_big_fil_rev_8_21_14_0_10_32_10]|uniref:Glycosyl hydrolase family 31 C-terminal domain-containing protein n=1 Tax=candidate division WWE3 bacterium CG10_big_fil_rev_8_21_14_0_10_32_10 TaxID=1975090 RepID=A0A2H0RD23_UNCKA|nr:MAG: hypothetical protein COV24_00095 [candidate division WWE3 bacterium CG10_big_fil_rev_8_21_14_0_10_32_10]